MVDLQRCDDRPEKGKPSQLKFRQKPPLTVYRYKPCTEHTSDGVVQSATINQQRQIQQRCKNSVAQQKHAQGCLGRAVQYCSARQPGAIVVQQGVGGLSF